MKYVKCKSIRWSIMRRKKKYGTAFIMNEMSKMSKMCRKNNENNKRREIK
jgi:hypothetical protein